MIKKSGPIDYTDQILFKGWFNTNVMLVLNISITSDRSLQFIGTDAVYSKMNVSYTAIKLNQSLNILFTNLENRWQGECHTTDPLPFLVIMVSRL